MTDDDYVMNTKEAIRISGVFRLVHESSGDTPSHPGEKYYIVANISSGDGDPVELNIPITKDDYESLREQSVHSKKANVRGLHIDGDLVLKLHERT